MHDIGFCVKRGERLIVLGPNGSGKTTLFKLLATLLPLQTGDIRVDAISLRDSPGEARGKLGVVFQSPSLDPKLTVYENMACHGALYALCGQELRRRIDRWLEVLDVRARSNKRVETLSGGLKRRVEIAKALLSAPSILLLDEPTTGLDPEVRVQLWQALDRLQEDEKLTILCTTHLLEETRHADQVAILDEGRLVAFGEPRALQSEFGGSVLCIEGPLAQIDPQLKLLAEGKGDVRLRRVRDTIWIQTPNDALLDAIFQSMRPIAQNISWSPSSMEDVYFQKTGKRWQGREAAV